MSTKYPAGVIKSSPVVPAGPYQNSSASGVWTMEQAGYWIKQGNWPTAGNLPPGQQEFVTNGTFTWVAPAGVTSISVVLVGAGGNVPPL